jgi:hypothetical protein
MTCAKGRYWGLNSRGCLLVGCSLVPKQRGWRGKGVGKCIMIPGNPVPHPPAFFSLTFCEKRP